MEKKYYEVEFAQKKFDTSREESDTYSICIIAEHYPSIEEVMEFCKDDMRNLGYSVVISVTPLDYEEAHKFFDMENEDNFPILK